MNSSAKRHVLLFVLLLATLARTSGAQTAPREETQEQLYRRVAALDTALFDAVNRCDLDKVASYFADDVEFYHDKGGLTRSRKTVVESIKNNLCGKVRRELVQGSLEVYPIPGYGAVEVGVHRFYELKSANPDTPSGEAKFMHIWQNVDGDWRITRVVSYAHEALK